MREVLAACLMGGLLGFAIGMTVRDPAPECPPPEMCLEQPCDEATCTARCNYERALLHSHAVGAALESAEECWRLNSDHSVALAACREGR